MVVDRHQQIGIDRLVRLTWLEKVASLVLSGTEDAVIKTTLQDDLQEAFRSGNTSVRGSLDKTITVLMKVWVRPPIELEALCIQGRTLLMTLPRKEHLAVHWGMLMAVYPFWSHVASQVGRILNLQGVVTALQIQRRIREQHGERETVARRARYVLRSFLDWGVLEETGVKGTYAAGTVLPIEDVQLIAWLAEASLYTRINGSAPLRELLDGANLFPFRLRSVPADSLRATSPRLEVIRHGLDDDLIMLRKQAE